MATWWLAPWPRWCQVPTTLHAWRRQDGSVAGVKTGPPTSHSWFFWILMHVHIVHEFSQFIHPWTSTYQHLSTRNPLVARCERPPRSSRDTLVPKLWTWTMTWPWTLLPSRRSSARTGHRNGGGWIKSENFRDHLWYLNTYIIYVYIYIYVYNILYIYIILYIHDSDWLNYSKSIGIGETLTPCGRRCTSFCITRLNENVCGVSVLHQLLKIRILSTWELSTIMINADFQLSSILIYCDLL